MDVTRRFSVAEAAIPGVFVLERHLLGDSRGYLERLYCSEELASLVGAERIEQVNHTLTRKTGTVRGLHYQRPPHAEIKIVSCIRGAVYDVVVDLRKGSPHFLRWHAEMLSADNHKTLIVPAGFAHGFQTLSDDCEMLYFHTAKYAPEAESGINALEPRVGVAWPREISERSPRDESHGMLAADFGGIRL